jgi:uncharacterized protein
MKITPDVVAILRSAKTIAVVGLSPDPARPSHGVARYLQRQGYRIVGINPAHRELLGSPAFETLAAAAAAVGPIEIVDVFRRSEFVPEIAAAAIAIGARLLWLQEGVSHPASEQAARDAGLAVVADHCLLKEHVKLQAQPDSHAGGQ